MSSPLEKFILENREKFDADAPDSRVWEMISERMNPTKSKKTAAVRSLPFKRWLSAAAAVVILGVSGVLYFSLHQNKPRPGTAESKAVKIEPSKIPPALSRSVDSPAIIAKTDQNPKTTIIAADKSQESAESGENKEMYYYAKLIELKHEELKTLEKDEPLLYRQFSGDVQKLDSVYHSLKTQLPNNSNREQVIEAMISNLQLQIGLLNKQLDIIKQIKHSKKSAYEKAYKSV